MNMRGVSTVIVRNDTQNDTVLWDNGKERLYIFEIPPENCYIPDKPCITIGFGYENARYKGEDVFVFVGEQYLELRNKIAAVSRDLNGSFRLYDMGWDTDGYIDINMTTNGKAEVTGRLGASFSPYSLQFELRVDQTVLTALLRILKI